MKYNFDELTQRRGTNSYKWDSSVDAEVLPLWVADMDFKTAPCIIDALKHRVEQGIFGYTKVPAEYYDATINWFSRRHGWKINGHDDFIYTSGVVPAVSAIIKALTKPGDKVIVQTPAYNCFFSSIRNNDCLLLINPLKRVNDSFEIDFDDLERCAADNDAKLLLLCNPHNPTGRVWTREELLRIDEICRSNGVKVISDEIHCELVYPPFNYIPFASLSDEAAMNCVTCVSPSKAFNIAGLQIANIISHNHEWLQLIDRAININEVCDVNPFGVIATIEAYNHGEEWLSELLIYLYDNYLTLRDYIAEHLPMLEVCRLEGTYLAWIDCRSLGIKMDTLEEILIRDSKVWLNAGTMYGAEGEGYMRVNLATSRARLLEALRKISPIINDLSKS